MAVVLAVVGLLVAGGVLIAVLSRQHAPVVGDCFAATGGGQKATDYSAFEKADCTAADAAYQVTQVDPDSCPSTTYGYMAQRSAKGQDRLYCLALNASAGDCFHQEVMFPTGKATKVACTDGATYEVVKVVEDTADAGACGPDAVEPHANDDLDEPMALVYDDPALTVCTEPV